MMKDRTYTQIQKNKVRHESLFHAVNVLTTNRNSSCCVDRNYVRKLYDYFMELDECNDKKEVLKMDLKYIRSWEQLHDSYLGHKKPEDLIVCYLSGPEPQNDFNELVSLGIHPQNIWAFENNNYTYLQAINNYNSLPFPQPKIVKGSIENFFKYTPKKFDIIYIDACGTIVSNQHALRIISSLFKFHRLNSPGIVITNFASTDEIDDFSKLIAQYLFFKDNLFTRNEKELVNFEILEDQIVNFKELINKNFEEYYGEFITRVLMDLSTSIIPGQRFANSQYYNSIALDEMKSNSIKVDLHWFDKAQNNAILQFLLLNYLLDSDVYKFNRIKTDKSKVLINEFSGLDKCSVNIYNSLWSLAGLKTDMVSLRPEIDEIKKHFNNKSIYQFLDAPNSNLFFDLIINQLSFPMHYNTGQIKRFKYKAKKTIMYTDVFVVDECRYIYEWLPTLHLVENAFKDLSWQYTFRFALDGLVKQRLNYNNEYFFQGSVVNKNNEYFKKKELSNRIFIK